MTDIDALFDSRITYPDISPQERLSRLVGLEQQKERLTKILGILINPSGLNQWVNTHHADGENLIDAVLRRPPLVVLAGDVGSGKTELAETIGDAVARQEGVDVTLYPLSLSTRGQGRVGEMTQLLSAAFDVTLQEGRKLKGDTHSGGGIILLVDEADALAQSRESAQMHHEDRAGVNAFIRGIDRIANEKLPVAVIMCTNRLNSLDPAVRRRAAEIMEFSRPNASQRKVVLSSIFRPLGFDEQVIDTLVIATGEREGRQYGLTFSDIMQRLLPSIVLDAYPSKPIDADRAVIIAQSLIPTPPFKEESA